MKTRSESVYAIMVRRRILFSGFVARMEDTRLPKCVMFGELVGDTGCIWSQEKSEWGASWTTSELSLSTIRSTELPTCYRNSHIPYGSSSSLVCLTLGFMTHHPESLPLLLLFSPFFFREVTLIKVLRILKTKLNPA